MASAVCMSADRYLPRLCLFTGWMAAQLAVSSRLEQRSMQPQHGNALVQAAVRRGEQQLPSSAVRDPAASEDGSCRALKQQNRSSRSDCYVLSHRELRVDAAAGGPLLHVALGRVRWSQGVAADELVLRLHCQAV